MRKEPIIAIIIGSLVGLGVAFFVWQYTNSAENNPLNNSNQNQAQNESTSKKTAIDTTVSEGEINLVSPSNLQVFTKSLATVSGILDSKSIVAVSNGDNIYLFNSDENGEFSTEIELSSGYQTIGVWSFTADRIANSSVDVIYTTQLESDTEEAIVRSALIGSVTDISENTIQINTPDDIIEQISVDEQTTYANNVGDLEESEFSEIAIGDFIIALGTLDTNILNSERVIVSESPAESAQTAIFGNIVELSASEFIVTHADGADYSIDATGKIDVTKFDENNEFVRARLSEATEQERIIIIGYIEDDELIAERIHIFPTATDE